MVVVVAQWYQWDSRNLEGLLILEEYHRAAADFLWPTYAFLLHYVNVPVHALVHSRLKTIEEPWDKP